MQYVGQAKAEHQKFRREMPDFERLRKCSILCRQTSVLNFFGRK